jgi:hypothetical protein
MPDLTLARERLGAALLARLAEDFAAHGVATIEDVRDKHPDAYLRLIAALLPKETPPRAPLEGLTDDELTAAIAELSRAPSVGA